MSGQGDSNPNNPETDAFWQARGLAKRSDNWQARIWKAERRKINKAKRRAWGELSSRIANAKATAAAKARQAAQEQAARDNRANQLNPNHPAYRAVRKQYRWRGGRLTRAGE